MYWLNKLREFKKEKKATYKSISEQTGIALTTIEKLYSGRTHDPKLLMVDKIVRFLGHSLTELLEDYSDMIIPDEIESDMILRVRRLDSDGKDRIESAIDTEEYRMKTHSIAHLYHKVFYDFPVSAGTGEFLDDSTVAIAELSEEPPHGTDYILRVAGNSMEPEFFDGDYIYVERTDTLVHHDIGIFSYGGSVYVKEYTKNGLRSLNPDYKTIPGSSDIKCLGKVLGKVSGILTVR